MRTVTAIPLPKALMSPAGDIVRPSAEDAMWLARAVEAEGAPRDLVAQTLVNRWLWLWDHGRPYATLTDLVRAYAQPVNPRWYRTGHLHLARRAAASDDEQRARLDARAERREYVHSTRTAFSPETTAAVSRALRGPLTLPVGAMHYAIPGRPYPVLVPGGDGRNAIYGTDDPRTQLALYRVAPAPRSVPRMGGRLTAFAVVAGLGLFLALVRG